MIAIAKQVKFPASHELRDHYTTGSNQHIRILPEIPGLKKRKGQVCPIDNCGKVLGEGRALKTHISDVHDKNWTDFRHKGIVIDCQKLDGRASNQNLFQISPLNPTNLLNPHCGTVPYSQDRHVSTFESKTSTMKSLKKYNLSVGESYGLRSNEYTDRSSFKDPELI